MNALVSVIQGFLGERIAFDGTTRAIVLRWFRIVYRTGFVLAVALLGANLFGDQIIESLQSIIAFLREPFFTAGTTRISVVTIILLLPIFYLATWAGNQTRHVLEHGVVNRLNLDPSRRFSFLSLSRYGVMIILSQPIKEGDRINIDELEGDVQQIRILYSVVNTISNETLIIPNRQILESVVHNQSYDDPSIMLRTPVPVSYRSDLDRVKAVLLSVGDRNSYRLHEKDPRVVFRSFDDSGITVVLVIPIGNAKDHHLARSEAIMEIWRAFRQNGIEIPFPQMDLHVKHLPAPEEATEGRVLCRS